MLYKKIKFLSCDCMSSYQLSNSFFLNSKHQCVLKAEILGFLLLSVATYTSSLMHHACKKDITLLRSTIIMNSYLKYPKTSISIEK